MTTREERRRALLAQFQAVAAERLAKLARTWVQVDQEQSGPQVDELFRELHTFKSEARVVGYQAAATTLHHLETLLFTARAQGFPNRRTVGDAVLAALDTVEEILSRPPEPRADGPPALVELLERMTAALSGAAAGAPPPGSRPPPAAGPPTGSGESFVRVAQSKVDGLSELCDQLLVLRAESAHAIQGLRAAAAEVEGAVRDLAPGLGPAGEALQGAARELARQMADHEESLYRQGLCVDSLDGAVRQMRFVQASSVLDAYPRHVREIALAAGKEVHLQLQGEEVEADRRILQSLREPLLHLVRNAVDHGTEPVEARAQAGKARAGTLRLAVAQRGALLAVEVEDDGRGMDPREIKARALELGIITQAQAGAMNDPEALELIFVTGFSIRPLADETSGRGIGMDVVKRRVEQIGGEVEVQSQPGRGTLVRLTVPLTVSVTRALLLEQGGETYAVAAAGVDAVRRITASELASVPGGEVLRHGEALLPVRRLWEEVGGSAGASGVCVVLRSGQSRVALLVDGVSREADLIVRPIEAPLGSPPPIAGAALLGSGRLILLLDTVELIRGSEAGGRRAVREWRRLMILVVEDSVIYQATIVDLLRSHGHSVAVAGNGIEGLERAAAIHPDLVITDLEMPRMDGLQLIRALRSREDLRRVPVITLSASGTRETSAQALASGANHCLVKAELDEGELLELIGRLTS